MPASSTAKGEKMTVKVWARRVWTLELSLVGSRWFGFSARDIADGCADLRCTSTYVEARMSWRISVVAV